MAVKIAEEHPLNWYVKPETDLRTRLGETIDHAEALAQVVSGEEFRGLNDAIQHRVICLLDNLLTSIRIDWQEVERIRYEERRSGAA